MCVYDYSEISVQRDEILSSGTDSDLFHFSGADYTAAPNIKGKEELIGAVIAFKTGAKSSAGSGKVGLMKLVAIGEKIGNNANARVFTFAVKLPKE